MRITTFCMTILVSLAVLASYCRSSLAANPNGNENGPGWWIDIAPVSPCIPVDEGNKTGDPSKQVFSATVKCEGTLVTGQEYENDIYWYRSPDGPSGSGYDFEVDASTPGEWTITGTVPGPVTAETTLRVCEVSQLEYKLPDGAWTTASSTVLVQKGTTIDFRATINPTGTWPTDEPDWTGANKTGIDGSNRSLASATFNTASTTSSDLKTVTVECGSSSKEASFLVIDIAITSGHVIIKQDSTPATHSYDATVTPSDRTILWSLSGPGADIVEFNCDTDDNPAVIQIKTPITAWVDDTTFTLTLQDSTDSSICDTKQVSLIKFRRNNLVASNSLPITVELENFGGDIGCTFGDCEGGYMSTSAFAEIDEVIADIPHENDIPETQYSVYYQSQNDACDGKYYIPIDNASKCEFGGSISLSGTYGGAGHNAKVSLAGAVTAGWNGNAVSMTNNEAGTGYTGSPLTVRLGISGDGEKIALGIWVTVTLVTQDSLSAQKSPSGSSYINVAEHDHYAGETIDDLNWMIRAAVGVRLIQQDDDEWKLEGSGNATIAAPENPVLKFKPNI